MQSESPVAMIVRRDNEAVELDVAVAPGAERREDCGGEAVLAAVRGELLRLVAAADQRFEPSESPVGRRLVDRHC